jgi:glycosyltransferase involved in cell wall biosynthesis
MATPEISVCVPVRNAGRHLAEAVASALAQDTDVEVLLHDDASSDGCVERLGPALDDARVRVERSHRRLGVALARNRLVARARAPFVAFLDADDALLPGALARTRDALGARPRAVLAHGAFELMDGTGRRLPDWDPPFESARTLDAAEAADELLLRNFLTTSTVTARREALLRAGPFDPQIGPSSTDWDMWLRLAEAGEVVYLNERLARYRQHEATISASTRAAGARLRSDVRVTRRALTRRRRGALPVPPRVRRQAEAALALKALTQAGDDATRGDRVGAVRALLTGMRAAPFLVRAGGPALAAAVAADREYAVSRRAKAVRARCARELACP